MFAAAAVGRFPLPACPRAPLSPRSKSAAFAYSEQVGAHMPKMHQTKLATIIIINCAVVLGEGRGWQTSLIIMKLSMCAAVLQQLCLAQQAGNDACYNNPQSPARPPVVRSREGCAAPEVPSRSSPCCSWEGDTRTVWGGGQTLFCCPFPVPCVCVQLLASCFVAWWCPPESCPWLSVCPVHLGAPSCTPISTWKNPQCKRQLKKSPSPAAPCPQSAVSPSLNGALELQQVSLCLRGPSLSTLLCSPCSLWPRCSAMGDAGRR